MYTSFDTLANDLSDHVRISVKNSDLPAQIIENKSRLQDWTFTALKKSSSRAMPCLIQTLLKKKPNENGKQIFVEKCRLYYADNQATLSMIDEFHETYCSENAVWWYTRQTFLYLLLNKSLRQQNIEMIVDLHFFLYDLHDQLAATYEGVHPRTEIEKYYRGQIMSSQEIAVLQTLGNLYGPITLNSFLSTTKEYGLASFFAGSGSYERDDELQSVIFIVELMPSDFNSMSKEYADIERLSASPSEKETLFTIASLLFLDGCTYGESEKTWFIKLTNWSSNDCFSCGRHTSEMQEQSSCSLDTQFIHIGRLLSERAADYNIFDLFDESRKNRPPVTEESFEIVKASYYDALLRNNLISQFVYDIGIGSLASMSGQMDLALQYLSQALLDKNQTHANESDPVLLLLYDTLGHVYREKGEYDLALKYYTVAVELDSKPDRLNHLACIHKIRGNYDYALALLSSYASVARAHDKRQDSITNSNEWKTFVDYTAVNEVFLLQHHEAIIREYLEIGKANAGISSTVFFHTVCEARLHIAIESFQRVIDLCCQFKVSPRSSHLASANRCITLARAAKLFITTHEQ